MSRGRGIKFRLKATIIAELNNGLTNSDLARKHRVSRHVVARLKDPVQQERIQTAMSSQTGQARRCRIQAGRFLSLENELIDWFMQKRTKGCALGTSLIKAKALKIRDYIIAQDPNMNTDLKNFKASNGWFENFKRRTDLRNKSIAGSEDTISEQVLVEGRQHLRESLSAYSPNNIFNVDESGLCFQQMPTRSYIQGSCQRKEVKCKKERITVMFCCSTTGEKLKPLIIGRSKKPRALKNTNIERLPCTYLANKKAWLTRSIFVDWVSKLNMEALRVSRKICLVMDNFSGHVLDETFTNVKLIYLPPGTTSVLQPLDCGIIRSFKSKYTEQLSRIKLLTCEQNYAFVPNIKDAIYFSANTWASVEKLTIRNCWRKANITNPTLFDLADIID